MGEAGDCQFGLNEQASSQQSVAVCGLVCLFVVVGCCNIVLGQCWFL